MRGDAHGVGRMPTARILSDKRVSRKVERSARPLGVATKKDGNASAAATPAAKAIDQGMQRQVLSRPGRQVERAELGLVSTGVAIDPDLAIGPGGIPKGDGSGG
jgi:hypothetical protein